MPPCGPLVVRTRAVAGRWGMRVLAPAEAVVAIAVTPAASATDIHCRRGDVQRCAGTRCARDGGPAHRRRRWQALQAASGPDGAVAFQVLLPSQDGSG